MIYFTDNKGYTVDRYSMIYKHVDANGCEYWDIYTMSENATSPQGINMFSCTLEQEPVFSKKEMICFNDLPFNVQKAVIARLQSEHDGEEIEEETCVHFQCNNERVEGTDSCINHQFCNCDKVQGRHYTINH